MLGQCCQRNDLYWLDLQRTPVRPMPPQTQFYTVMADGTSAQAENLRDFGVRFAGPEQFRQLHILR